MTDDRDPSPFLSPIRNRWALLVGVNSYDDFGISPLKYCVNDVKALEPALMSLGYEVICLHDDQPERGNQPTRSNVTSALKHLCDGAEPNDLVFVHFSCHGKLWEQQPVLILQDTHLNLLAEQSLRLARVEDALKASPARRLVLSLDACHAGVERGKRALPDPEFIYNVYDTAEGFAVLSASTAQQEALEDGDMQHGVYTHYLLEALQGKADFDDKQFVTVSDTHRYVMDSLKRLITRKRLQWQEPTIKTETLGDIILADYRDRPPPPPVVTTPPDGEIGDPPRGTSRTPMSLAQTLKREALEQELAARTRDFKDVDQKYRREMNPAEKNALNDQRNELLAEIQDIENQLNALK